jgi:ferritin-like metal-binding protein YciE
MKLSSLNDLFIDELKDLYSAENQILKELPKMADNASNFELRAGFREHLEQTREHVSRLEQIFEALGEEPGGKRCRGMEGVLEEGGELLKQDAEPGVKDAGLISTAQRVEHYEMAGYGSARSFAQMLGISDAAILLQQTLNEEKETDRKLTALAEKSINARAL